MKNWYHNIQIGDMFNSPQHGIGLIVSVDRRTKSCHVVWSRFEGRFQQYKATHYYLQINFEVSELTYYPVVK